MRFTVAGLLCAFVVTACASSRVAAPTPPSTTATTAAPSITTVPVAPPTNATAPRAPAPAAPIALAGCPPPPRPPGPPGPPPWHPAVLVPDAALPEPPPPPRWTSDVAAIDGKGMWVWQLRRTESGVASAIVDRAARTGLHQLWVRVGDSRDGFYGGPTLAQIVGPAHRAGLKVIGWGFPYLYDPVRDAGWTAQALAWRGPDGDTLDGFSADIEKSSEGVALSTQRVAVYLGTVRRSAGSRLLVATVYRPTDLNWLSYPYRTMAAYVDAFAPMVYWGCNDPVGAARQAVERLGSLRPVHVIGQGYNMVSDGGRDASPSPEELWGFLATGRRAGAIGASFWVWQEMTPVEWGALAWFPWAV